MPSIVSTLAFLTLWASASAHMSIYHPSMYGMNAEYPPFAPLGPGWHFDDWWFRGALNRASPPPDGVVAHLPAGGTFMFEIACHIAWTSYGCCALPDNKACPAAGPYHSGDPADDAPVDYNLLAGCALAIADVENIADVTVDNLAVFSVQHECVWQRETTFEIPARMPPCTGKHCICAWMWEPQNGTGNFYQTPFHCDITGSPVDATPISTPLKDPVFCEDDPSTCVTGAKRPIYFYNEDYWNVQWYGNYWRPGYFDHWSWKNGAQDDIFMTAIEAANYTRPNITASIPANVSHVYPLNTDLALNAVATASSYLPQSPPSAANDGIIGGLLDNGMGNASTEWASNGQGAGSWLTLTWANPVTINLVVLYDRPNMDDTCWAGKLTFSDGSIVIFGALDNAGGPTPVTLDPRTTTSLTYTCTSTSVFTTNAGLSEIEVYGPTVNTTAPANTTVPANTTSPANVTSAVNSTIITSTPLPTAVNSSIAASSGFVPSSLASNATVQATSSAIVAGNTTTSQLSTTAAPASSTVSSTIPVTTTSIPLVTAAGSVQTTSAPSTTLPSSSLSSSSSSSLKPVNSTTSAVPTSTTKSSSTISSSTISTTKSSSTISSSTISTTKLSSSSSSSTTTKTSSSTTSSKTSTTSKASFVSTSSPAAAAASSAASTTTKQSSSSTKQATSTSVSPPPVQKQPGTLLMPDVVANPKATKKPFNLGNGAPLMPLGALPTSWLLSTAGTTSTFSYSYPSGATLATIQVPTNTSLCFIPTPTVVTTTSTLCVGRLCTATPLTTLLSQTLCATPSSLTITSSSGVKVAAPTTSSKSSTKVTKRAIATESAAPTPSQKSHVRDFSLR